MLTKDDLQAISDLMDRKLDEKLDERFERELSPIKQELKELKGSVNLLNVKVDRNTRKLKEMDLSMKNIKFDNDRKFARLQDGMDTVEQVLRMNRFIPC